MEAFPNLLNEFDSSLNDEGFWPSFTDIMMVVVMIFLISTTILIVRNVELVKALTETAAAEKEAQKATRTTLAENITLEERVAALEDLLSATQLEQMRTREEKETLAARVDELINNLAQSTRSRESLQAELAARAVEIQTMIAQLSQLENEQRQASEELALKRADLSSKQSELAAAISTIDSLRASQQQQAESYQAFQLQAGLTRESLTALQKEYAALQSQYDKLVRPARTTKGKHVVAVRFTKENGVKRYEIKDAAERGFTQTTEASLHTQLQNLKNRHKDKLYIRIIFPDNNRLTYKEAWGFTNNILNKYDYYNQETKTEAP